MAIYCPACGLGIYLHKPILTYHCRSFIAPTTGELVQTDDCLRGSVTRLTAELAEARWAFQELRRMWDYDDDRYDALAAALSAPAPANQEGEHA